MKENTKILDLGTGTGIIPILLAGKTKARQIYGIDIQSISVDMSKRSVAYNGLEDRIHIEECDIKKADHLFSRDSFQAITCNPPYMIDHHGLKNPELPKAIARHEILCDLEDIIRTSSNLLKVKGDFYMIHRPFRQIGRAHV